MARKFILQEIEGSSMVSTWTDALYCSVLKNGTLSLRMNKTGEDGSWWSPAIRNIRTPRQFLEAIDNVGWGIEDWDIDVILKNLHRGHPIFAILVEEKIAFTEVRGETAAKIQIVVKQAMKHVRMDLPTGTTNTRVFIGYVEDFTKKHFSRTGTAPQGVHLIRGRVVDFSAEDQKTNQKPRRETKTDKLIIEYAEKAVWEKFKGRPHPQWANASRLSRIQKFVKSYFRENKRMPCGTHDIDGLEVKFPKDD